MSLPFTDLKWRIGQESPLCIFGQKGEAPDQDDPFIGMMVTATVAEAVVHRHNTAYNPSAGWDPDRERAWDRWADDIPR